MFKKIQDKERIEDEEEGLLINTSIQTLDRKMNTNFKNTFLPNEIFVVIFSFLNEKSLLIITQTNKRFREISTSDFVWKEKEAFHPGSIYTYLSNEKLTIEKTPTETTYEFFLRKKKIMQNWEKKFIKSEKINNCDYTTESCCLKIPRWFHVASSCLVIIGIFIFIVTTSISTSWIDSPIPYIIALSFLFLCSLPSCVSLVNFAYIQTYFVERKSSAIHFLSTTKKYAEDSLYRNSEHSTNIICIALFQIIVLLICFGIKSVSQTLSFSSCFIPFHFTTGLYVFCGFILCIFGILFDRNATLTKTSFSIGTGIFTIIVDIQLIIFGLWKDNYFINYKTTSVFLIFIPSYILLCSTFVFTILMILHLIYRYCKYRDNNQNVFGDENDDFTKIIVGFSLFGTMLCPVLCPFILLLPIFIHFHIPLFFAFIPVILFFCCCIVIFPYSSFFLATSLASSYISLDEDDDFLPMPLPDPVEEFDGKSVQEIYERVKEQAEKIEDELTKSNIDDIIL